MNITLLYSAPPKCAHKLDRVTQIVSDVLTELGLSVTEIDLFARRLPSFSGQTNGVADEIVGSIRESAGIIFAAAVQLPGVPAIMQNFLEYLTLGEYSDALENKNCLLLAVSDDGGERACLDDLSRVLGQFGAFGTVKAGLQSGDVDKIVSGDSTRDDFEKIMEDFYRMVRQNRHFFIPYDFSKRTAPTAPAISEAEQDVLESIETKKRISASELTKRLDLDSLNQDQASDVDEISNFFSRKISEHPKADKVTPVFVQSLSRDDSTVARRSANCRQLSRSLPRHFQPQLSNGLNAVIQLQINGAETFSGYYTLTEKGCDYADGTAASADITILSDDAVWTDVLTGKCSAQKAFMIGKLKVRGNFVLLTKFDQLFRIGA